MRHFIDFKEWSAEELADLLERALDVKRHPENYSNSMEKLTLAMVFQKTSTRTRVSFETGMTQMGGHAIHLDWRATNLVLAEAKDEVRYISRNVDLIMARLLKNATVREMAAYSRVPVINGCCDLFHPCQAFCDLLTVREKFGRTEGVHIVYTGLYNNVSNSLVELCPKLGARITVVAPERKEDALDAAFVRWAEERGLYGYTTDLAQAVKDADVVYTDTWLDMEFFLDPAYQDLKKQREQQMRPFQLNAGVLEGSRALIMHDMPIHEGYEITREVIESPNSIIFDQAENRMHGEKAIMLRLLGKA